MELYRGKRTTEIMFKKVMEIPYSLIIKYYELATDEHPDGNVPFFVKVEY